MVDLHRIEVEDIELGRGLPWDILDKSGNLLLAKGYVVKDLAQAVEMAGIGMFIEESLYTKLPAYDKISRAPNRIEPAPMQEEDPSVLRSLNMAVKRLGVLLKEIHKFQDAQARVLEIVTLIRSAIHLNEDLALASMQLYYVRDNYAVRHCVDAAILSIIVAEAMQKSPQEIQDLAAAALTMNISMIDVQERLQDKKGELSREERTLIRNHPIASIDRLYEAGIENPEWLKYVLLHHEHEDGSGYPIGNVKSEIPQNAKILSLADGFCARVSLRGYRRSTLPSVALRDIFIENKAHADATLAAYFIKVLGLYPPGTFVQLKNQEVAIVSQRGSGHSICTAHSLVKANGELFATPMKRDTSLEPYTIVEAIYPTQAAVHVSPQLIWGPLASL